MVGIFLVPCTLLDRKCWTNSSRKIRLFRFSLTNQMLFLIFEQHIQLVQCTYVIKNKVRAFLNDLKH